MPEIPHCYTASEQLEAVKDRYDELLDEEAMLIQAGWPWPLVKAINDPFTYAIGLRDTSVIKFEQASYDKRNLEWVTILPDNLTIVRMPVEPQRWFCFDRGLAIRVSDILWAADAPEGS